MSKEITIPVPDGKRAEWINGVLTLVDEQKVDNRPVTERIKTFTDACNALGDEHPLVTQYRLTAAAYKGDPMTEDFIASVSSSLPSMRAGNLSSRNANTVTSLGSTSIPKRSTTS